ncbi:hypothetical protein ACIRRI_53660 [Streptomyces mirabilis]|uniref:hypothetical protein n=1 Tax=Streptomyces mirabilis TaxID=68239 RepID=UPI0038250F80
MINAAAAPFQTDVLALVGQVGGYWSEPVQQPVGVGGHRRPIGVRAGRGLPGQPFRARTRAASSSALGAGEAAITRPKHGGEFVLGDPATWGTEQAVTPSRVRQIPR